MDFNVLASTGTVWIIQYIACEPKGVVVKINEINEINDCDSKEIFCALAVSTVSQWSSDQCRSILVKILEILENESFSLRKSGLNMIYDIELYSIKDR